MPRLLTLSIDLLRSIKRPAAESECCKERCLQYRLSNNIVVNDKCGKAAIRLRILPELHLWRRQWCSYHIHLCWFVWWSRQLLDCLVEVRRPSQSQPGLASGPWARIWSPGRISNRFEGSPHSSRSQPISDTDLIQVDRICPRHIWSAYRTDTEMSGFLGYCWYMLMIMVHEILPQQPWRRLKSLFAISSKTSARQCL